MEHDNGPADHPPDLRPLAARLRFTISRLARSRDTLPERGSGDRADNTDAATDEPVRTPDAVSPDDDDDYLRRVNLARRSTWRFRGPLRTDESPRMDVYCRVCRLPIYLELTDYDTIYSGLLVTTQAPEWASLRAVGPERQSARRTTQGREGERRYACSNGCSKHQVVLTVSERPIRPALFPSRRTITSYMCDPSAVSVEPSGSSVKYLAMRQDLRGEVAMHQGIQIGAAGSLR